MFAWLLVDMPRVDPRVISHSLNVDPVHRSIKQKKRHFISDRIEAVNQEVDKLLEAGFIRKANYL